MDIPPQLVAEADQQFAEINGVIDNTVELLRQGMMKHPEFRNSPSLLWARSTIDYREELERVLNPQCERAIHHHTADLMIAAIFRLAQQEDRGA